MAGESVCGLLNVDSAEGNRSEQKLANENQGQMDLYDDLINDIIGVPLNNGLNPKKVNYERLPKCTSNNIIVPIKAPPKRCVPDKIGVSPPEEKILLIGNLTWWTTGDDLVAAIRSAGIFNVDKIKFYEVHKGGQSKGFVRVHLSSDWDVNRLLRMLPKKVVNGRTPDVRRFTTANRQYFETQFINAMAKSKLHSAQNDIFDDYPARNESHYPAQNESHYPAQNESQSVTVTVSDPPKEANQDDGSEDYGTLLRLVSFVKKSKAIAQDSYRDSLNCPPNLLHGGEAKPYSSRLREHEYPRHRENQRSGERSGPLRDRSKSPSSCDGHYQEKKMDYYQEKKMDYYREKKMDYDRERQKSPQRIHFQISPRIDHHPDRSREQKDNFSQKRPCDSLRYPARNSDPWHIYSEKSGKGQGYSREKYCGRKQEKDREYRF